MPHVPKEKKKTHGPGQFAPPTEMRKEREKEKGRVRGKNPFSQFPPAPCFLLSPLQTKSKEDEDEGEGALVQKKEKRSSSSPAPFQNEESERKKRRKQK